jgi:hypothetical protein
VGNASSDERNLERQSKLSELLLKEKMKTKKTKKKTVRKTPVQETPDIVKELREAAAWFSGKKGIEWLLDRAAMEIESLREEVKGLEDYREEVWARNWRGED